MSIIVIFFYFDCMCFEIFLVIECIIKYEVLFNYFGVVVINVVIFFLFFVLLVCDIFF